MTGLLDGDTCKLPPPPKKTGDKHDKKFMNVLHTIKAYKIAGKLEPVGVRVMYDEECLHFTALKEILCHKIKCI